MINFFTLLTTQSWQINC